LKKLFRQQRDSRRWWVLAIVVAAQFMFVVDAFIVNAAIPRSAPTCTRPWRRFRA
jgi:hypothetical protein